VPHPNDQAAPAYIVHPAIPFATMLRVRSLPGHGASLAFLDQQGRTVARSIITDEALTELVGSLAAFAAVKGMAPGSDVRVIPLMSDVRQGAALECAA